MRYRGLGQHGLGQRELQYCRCEVGRPEPPSEARPEDACPIHGDGLDIFAAEDEPAPRRQ